MGGTKEGARITVMKNLANDPDFYKKIGYKGGTTPTNKLKGFAAMPPSKRAEAGRVGGSKSRRTGVKNGAKHVIVTE